MTISKRFAAWLCVLVLPMLAGVMRITEYMHSGANGEFIEFTNVGNASRDDERSGCCECGR